MPISYTSERADLIKIKKVVNESKLTTASKKNAVEVVNALIYLIDWMEEKIRPILKKSSAHVFTLYSQESGSSDVAIPIHLEAYKGATLNERELLMKKSLIELFIKSFSDAQSTPETLEIFCSKLIGNCIDARTRDAFDYAAKFSPRLEDLIKAAKGKIVEKRHRERYFYIMASISTHYWNQKVSKDPEGIAVRWLTKDAVVSDSLFPAIHHYLESNGITMGEGADFISAYLALPKNPVVRRHFINLIREEFINILIVESQTKQKKEEKMVAQFKLRVPSVIYEDMMLDKMESAKERLIMSFFRATDSFNFITTCQMFQLLSPPAIEELLEESDLLKEIVLFYPKKGAEQTLCLLTILAEKSVSGGKRILELIIDKKILNDIPDPFSPRYNFAGFISILKSIGKVRAKCELDEDESSEESMSSASLALLSSSRSIMPETIKEESSASAFKEVETKSPVIRALESKKEAKLAQQALEQEDEIIGQIATILINRAEVEHKDDKIINYFIKCINEEFPPMTAVSIFDRYLSTYMVNSKWNYLNRFVSQLPEDTFTQVLKISDDNQLHQYLNVAMEYKESDLLNKTIKCISALPPNEAIAIFAKYFSFCIKERKWDFFNKVISQLDPAMLRDVFLEKNGELMRQAWNELAVDEYLTYFLIPIKEKMGVDVIASYFYDVNLLLVCLGYEVGISRFFMILSSVGMDAATIRGFFRGEAIKNLLNSPEIILTLYRSYKKTYGSEAIYNLFYLISTQPMVDVLSPSSEGREMIRAIMSTTLRTGQLEAKQLLDIGFRNKLSKDQFLSSEDCKYIAERFEVKDLIAISPQLNDIGFSTVLSSLSCKPKALIYLRELFESKEIKLTFIHRDKLTVLRPLFKGILTTQKYEPNLAMATMLFDYLNNNKNPARFISAIKALLVLGNPEITKKTECIAEILKTVNADHQEKGSVAGLGLFPANVTKSRLAVILSNKVIDGVVESKKGESNKGEPVKVLSSAHGHTSIR